MLKRLLYVLCLLLLRASVYGQGCLPPVNFTRTLEAPIHNVTFSNDALLPPQKEDEIAKWVRAQGVDPRLVSSGMASIAEETGEKVRSALQDDGYFNAQVRADAVPVAADRAQYNIVVQVVSTGPQYRLGDLNIVQATWFPTAQLHNAFPVQRGEIFSSEKIAAGLANLRQLYNSQGYINFVSVPHTQLDDASAVANLTIMVDEGKQFRLRRVEVLGLDPETKARVLGSLAVKPGEVYDSELWNQSLVKYQDLVPDAIPRSANQSPDEKNGRIDVTLDFRRVPVCPPQNPAPELVCEFVRSKGICRNRSEAEQASEFFDFHPLAP